MRHYAFSFKCSFLSVSCWLSSSSSYGLFLNVNDFLKLPSLLISSTSPNPALDTSLMKFRHSFTGYLFFSCVCEGGISLYLETSLAAISLSLNVRNLVRYLELLSSKLLPVLMAPSVSAELEDKFLLWRHQ